ncbi:unnamed protein product [Paramecium sonneborni]|uniref:Uncharacterized protein n=1 Tax=Paramecium sonneborni TaxID=65129 RepID=A0A8S1RRF6_9CILI|nr:unnamed protein product [Paramecium sonneborni]
MEKEISLYPTEGEYYEYNLYELAYQNAYVLYEKGQQNYDLQDINQIIFKNYQLRWITHPNIENIQIMHQFQEIYNISGNQFKSLSSNNTHYVALSLNNEITIYEWKNKVIEQIGSTLKINPSYNCFSIHLSIQFNILLDCYQNNYFYLVNINDFEYNIVYSSSSSEPIRTKLQSIINGNNTYIIYCLILLKLLYSIPIFKLILKFNLLE